MLVNKAYKFRIYPNKEQEILTAKTIGCSRFVFNHFQFQHDVSTSRKQLIVADSALHILQVIPNQLHELISI